MPADFGKRAAIALGLAQSQFHRHLLERFLEWLGRPLRLPWWSVHLLMYFGTVALVFGLVELRAAYPGPGRISVGLQLAAECLFTSFVLSHLRQARSQAAVIAAEIESGKDRLHWLRCHLAPFSQGWCLAPKPSVRGTTPTVLWLRPWHLVTLLLGLFYSLVAYSALQPTVTDPWCLASPQILLLYTHTAKAAMIVALLSHVWWLQGVARVSSASYPSALSPLRRQVLLHSVKRKVFCLTLVVSLAAGFWMLAYGLCWGTTWWAYLLAAGVVAFFLIQAAVLRLSFRLRAATFAISTGTLFALAPLLRSVLRSYRPADLAVVLAAASSPPTLNAIGALLKP